MRAQYYLLYGRLNVARTVGADYAYLDRSAGKWVSDNRLFNAITGAGGDASTVEVSEEEARAWIERNAPGLDAVDLTNAT